jgi:hypothetical protein
MFFWPRPLAASDKNRREIFQRRREFDLHRAEARRAD